MGIPTETAYDAVVRRVRIQGAIITPIGAIVGAVILYLGYGAFRDAIYGIPIGMFVALHLQMLVSYLTGGPNAPKWELIKQAKRQRSAEERVPTRTFSKSKGMIGKTREFTAEQISAVKPGELATWQKYALSALVMAIVFAVFFAVKSGQPLFGLVGIPFGVVTGLAVYYGQSHRKTR
jgi:hypothetical protein